MSESAPELTAELIVDSAVPLYPVVSPDGRWVAYAVTPIGMREEHPTGALWVAAADGSSPPRKLTAGTAKDSVPRWAPDSASLFFVSDRMKRGVPQLHRISLDGGEAEALTAWKGGISDHLPLADPHVVAVVAADEPTEEDERRKAERDDAKVWGERVPYGRLRLLDLGTGELRVVERLGDRHVVEVVQRPDGGPLAVISWACPELDSSASTAGLHVVDPVTGAVHDLGRIEWQACSPTWWSLHDVWHVAYLAVTPPSPVGGLAVLDVTVPAADTAGEQRNLTAGMTVCPTDLAQVADGPPLALFADGLDTAIYRLDPEAQRFVRMSTRDGRVDSLTVSRSGEVVAARASTAYEPMNVHAGPPGGRLIRLSDTRPELRQIRWGTQERLSYKASDGLDLDGLLILPAGRSRQDGPFPLVTLVHGGPDDRYTDEFNLAWFPSGQWLATAGYAVFLPNPRGGWGHGHEFAAAVAGRVGLEEWTDIVSGIDLLIADGVADPDRLGIGGGSHGGFMAAWAIGQTDRFKAALMGSGISDWGMLVATGEQATLDAGLGGSAGWEGSGPHPHDRLSPISFASKIRTPVLIRHGENDTNVPLSQATFFHRALRHFGVEHEFVVYPREGHSFRERNHQIDVLRRTRAWFDRWLGDPASDQNRI
ncbi:S9 family peptidase [Streptosporangium sp. NPDC004379]|uniref:S9 family peptidase n=1 Tax=Streptosporangium sp. NPDC004379 TaxID=3366189 RepID=UPI00367B8255